MDPTKKQDEINHLKVIWDTFLREFSTYCQNAIQLRSKKPAVFWKVLGKVAYASVSRFPNPKNLNIEPPFLIRLDVNHQAPQSLFLHLKSPKVRKSLGVQGEPQLATEPQLTLYFLPQEISGIGEWLGSWYAAQVGQFTIPPLPPFPLVDWVDNQDGKAVRVGFKTLKSSWKDATQLWTEGALDLFEPGYFEGQLGS